MKLELKDKVIKRSKPRICIVTHFNCLRNIKSSIGAWLNGYDLELITRMEGFGLVHELQFDHIYKSIRIYDTPSQVEKFMLESDADVFWCHNEPDLMTQLACLPHIKRDRLVIHDCHDLPTLHKELAGSIDVQEQERDAICNSDYTFVPTESYVDLLEKKYNLQGQNKILTVYSASPHIFFPDGNLPRVNGMLYCGQLNATKTESKLKYRHNLGLFQTLTGMGIASHIYHTQPQEDLTEYTLAGASVYGVLRMFAAIHQFTRYDYGYVGAWGKFEEIDLCMPNKLFDCIAAGLPLIVHNASVAGKWVTDLGIGISVTGEQEFINIPWADFTMWEKMRKKCQEIRHEYTAEKEVKKAFERIGI